MLAAVDEKGNPVVLAGFDAKQLAIRLKKKPHFCPQCGCPVVIKAGSVNIPHFAHQSFSSCSSFSEPESSRHLSGKLDLYNWISRTQEAQIEARLPGGFQRPDILSGKIAVEYQCSTISADLFRARTEGYKAHGLTPLWVYGGSFIERKGSYIKLTPFHRLFLHYHKKLGFYLISYWPDSRLFSIYYRIVPVAGLLCMAKRLDVKAEELVFPPAVALSAEFRFSLFQFWEEKRKWMDRSLSFNNARIHPFFRAVYESGRNPYLLPEEIGLPVRSGIAIRNHPAEWQFWILHDRKTGSIKEAANIVRRRIQWGHLKETILPLAPAMTPEQAAEDYMRLLSEIETGNQLDSRSMAGKIQKEKEFCFLHEKRVRDKLIF